MPIKVGGSARVGGGRFLSGARAGVGGTQPGRGLAYIRDVSGLLGDWPDNLNLLELHDKGVTGGCGFVHLADTLAR